MARHQSNGDKMLQLVLDDADLIKYAEYDPLEFETIDEAQISDNPVVKSIGYIFSEVEASDTDKEIYNNVTNILKSGL